MQQKEVLEGAQGDGMVTIQKKKAPWTLKALSTIMDFRLEIFGAF